MSEVVLALVAVWGACVRIFDVPRFLLRAPSEIAQLGYQDWPLIQMHSLHTIGSILAGYVAAVAFALGMSALMIRFPLAERLIMPTFMS